MRSIITFACTISALCVPSYIYTTHFINASDDDITWLIQEEHPTQTHSIGTKKNDHKSTTKTLTKTCTITITFDTPGASPSIAEHCIFIIDEEVLKKTSNSPIQVLKFETFTQFNGMPALSIKTASNKNERLAPDSIAVKSKRMMNYYDKHQKLRDQAKDREAKARAKRDAIPTPTPQESKTMAQQEI